MEIWQEIPFIAVDGTTLFCFLRRSTLPERVEWIQVAQDNDHWPALVSTVMNLQVSLKVENF